MNWFHEYTSMQGIIYRQQEKQLKVTSKVPSYMSTLLQTWLVFMTKNSNIVIVLIKATTNFVTCAGMDGSFRGIPGKNLFTMR